MSSEKKEAQVKVKFLVNTVAEKTQVKPGQIRTLNESEARLLIRMKRCVEVPRESLEEIPEGSESESPESEEVSASESEVESPEKPRGRGGRGRKKNPGSEPAQKEA